LDEEQLESVHKPSVVDLSNDALSEDSLTDHINPRPTRNFMRFGRRAPGMAFNCYPIFDRQRLLEQLRPLVSAQDRIVGNSIAMISAYDNRKRFMRFGKRFMRFGRSDTRESNGKGGMLFHVIGSKDSGKDDNVFEGSSKRFMRFGKRFMRFGRSRSSTEPSGHVTDTESPPGDDIGVSYHHQKGPVDIVCFAGKDDVITSATLQPSSDKRFMRFGRKVDATMTEPFGGNTDTEDGTELQDDA